MAFIAARKLVLPFLALFYSIRTTMSGSGWFPTVAVLGGVLAGAIPGLERVAGWVMLSSMLAFLDRRQKDRESAGPR